jgi:hypothetical protein
MIAGTIGNFFWQLGGGRWATGYDAGESLRIRRDLGYNRSTPRDEEGFVAWDGTRWLGAAGTQQLTPQGHLTEVSA